MSGVRLIGSIVGLVLVLAAPAVFAPAAYASNQAGASDEGVASAPATPVVPACVIDADDDCVQTVRGTAEASAGLNIRSGPGTGFSVVGSMPFHSTGTVFCFASGTNINGDPWWDFISTNGKTGYVSDFWLFTGGDITTQVDPC